MTASPVRKEGTGNAEPSQPRIALVGMGAVGDGVLRAVGSMGKHDVQVAPLPGDLEDDACRGRPPSQLQVRECDSIDDCLDGCAVCIVAADEPSASALLPLNARCLELSIPLFPGLALGSVGQVGPAVRGGEGPCLHCVELRLLAAAGRSCLRSYGPPDALLAKLVANAVTARALDPERREATEWLTYHRAGEAISCHPILRMRRCPACKHIGRQPSYRGPRVFAFRDRPPSDASHILSLKGRLVDPITGPITSLRLYSPEPPDPPLRHAVATLVDDGWRAAGFQTVTCGGVSPEPDKANAAALGEAIERSTAVIAQPDELVIARYCEIEADGIDPRNWDLFDPETRGDPDFPYPPPSPKEPMSWVWAWSLTGNRPSLVPASRVFLALEPPLSGDFFDCALVSGFAVGNTLEEATERALLELIERDAFMIAWANRLPLRHVPPAGMGASATAFEQPGLDVRCGLIELDLGAPTAIAMVRSTRPGDPALVVAAAADLDVGRACERALNELAANRLHVRQLLSGKDEQIHPTSPTDIRDQTAHGLLYSRPEMLAEAAFWWEQPAPEIDAAQQRASSPGSQVRSLVDSISRAGLEAFVVDLTPPEIRSLGLWAVKALIPGAYPMNFDSRWPHLGGRRIHEAPVAAGLRDKPLPTGQLNRFPHPFP